MAETDVTKRHWMQKYIRSSLLRENSDFSTKLPCHRYTFHCEILRSRNPREKFEFQVE